MRVKYGADKMIQRASLIVIFCFMLSPLVHAQPVRDLATEEQNRRIVLNFYNAFFGRHEIDVAERVLSEDYIQHNPRVASGRSAFVAVFSRLFASNPDTTSQVVRSGTGGDLVFLHSHVKTSPIDRGRAITDIFRVSQGKIVEHWDVIQDVPEAAANANTMF